MLRILHLEDKQRTAEIARDILTSEGIPCEVTRVETQSQFEQALREQHFDLILADMRLPAYDGKLAMEHARTHYPVIPFIVFSGSMGEELAIETLKQGATDYVLKDNIQRLAPSVRRALKEAEEHRRRREAEEALRKLNEELEVEVSRRTQELQHAYREMEGFSYAVSHDLRAPLRAINSFARVLQEDHAQQLDIEGKRLLDVIHQNANRMGQLIERLLEFSRLSKQALRKQTVDMKALVLGAIDDVKSGNSTTGAFIVNTLPPAQGDTILLRQVWTNLLSNAVKFSQKKADPRIEIGSMVEERETVYFVKDNGIGFDMGFSNKLFGVFERLHDPKIYDGVGIGLAFSKRIIERHGGKIWGEGKAGEGATFYFSLPAGAQ